MSQAIADILADRFDEEPPEIQVIKKYIQENFDQAVAVTMRDQQIVITTKTSAQAGALRPHLYKLRQLCDTNKRLTIRIGS
jgi:hypothetical protein